MSKKSVTSKASNEPQISSLAKPARSKPSAVAAKPIAPKDADIKPESKIDTVIAMLRARSGASIEQLTKATGWQGHSVRGAISGQLKKKLGLNVLSEKLDGTRLYRIAK